MHTEINFRFTARANAALRTKQSTNFAMTTEMPLLIAGDFFSTEALMPHVFVVVQRYVHLVAPDHLQVEYLLDLRA